MACIFGYAYQQGVQVTQCVMQVVGVFHVVLFGFNCFKVSGLVMSM
jgi:hypothetical protein